MICAWIETSSAETGSSQTTNCGIQRQRAGDTDALSLAAGELVGVTILMISLKTAGFHHEIQVILIFAIWHDLVLPDSFANDLAYR